MDQQSVVSRSSLSSAFDVGDEGKLPAFATGAVRDNVRATEAALTEVEAKWGARLREAAARGGSWEAQARRRALDDFHRIRKEKAALLKAERRTARLHTQLLQQKAMVVERMTTKRRERRPRGLLHAVNVITTPEPFHWGLSRAFPVKPLAPVVTARRGQHRRTSTTSSTGSARPSASQRKVARRHVDDDEISLTQVSVSDSDSDSEAEAEPKAAVRPLPPVKPPARRRRRR
ncbi:uncharacterized protein AMSG_11826 [Thecamonas trahens ATCC 50062]|uniref:Uncharacterized protein n=1 Tax=Thecamonas trahens ATCC 50062 TaxID=461836 RepID=A0A0L0D7N9_THETB|nr:hypothetical protein AMSG_11826 [Thecamonas trahens ATCC 50062]KNC48374.1 hypothetical protein AMSG_11826 [Thecamonas trahens ATCC 50062]|eukprot:XP_013758661.1 hypothetical protein AMSG_11826 [Thecamonas trahens ATCC 50062]